MFKKGDKVRIRNDLIVGKDYNGQTFVNEMEQYKGKVATITCAFNEGDYNFDIDDECWDWNDEMLELVEVKTNLDYILEHYIGVSVNGFGDNIKMSLMFQFSPNDKNRVGLRDNNNPERLKEWLLSPYEEPKIKLTQFEYDLLGTASGVRNSIKFGKVQFKDMGILIEMKEKGYYKNIDIEMTLEEILERCEVND